MLINGSPPACLNMRIYLFNWYKAVTITNWHKMTRLIPPLPRVCKLNIHPWIICGFATRYGYVVINQFLHLKFIQMGFILAHIIHFLCILNDVLKMGRIKLHNINIYTTDVMIIFLNHNENGTNEKYNNGLAEPNSIKVFRKYQISNFSSYFYNTCLFHSRNSLLQLFFCHLFF